MKGLGFLALSTAKNSMPYAYKWSKWSEGREVSWTLRHGNPMHCGTKS